MHLLAMRETDPGGLAALIARRRVERAIRWLNTVRPHDWWKTFYHPENDQFWARAEYDNECPLALAFKPEQTLRGGTFFEVTYAQVANHLNLRRSWLITHGFQVHENPTRKPWVTSDLLNTAWRWEVKTSPLILREAPVPQETPSSREGELKGLVERMIRSIRIRRIMQRAGILRPRTT